MADKTRTISPLSGNQNTHKQSDENQADITRTLSALIELLADQSAEQMFASAARTTRISGAKQASKPMQGE